MSAHRLAQIGLAGFILAACLVFISPRWGYPYPTHTDEWTHLAYAEALIEQGKAPHAEPLYGQGMVGFRPELGFRALLAEAHLATGIAWERMFPVLPGVLFVAFAVSMLYLGRLLGAGPLVGIMALGTPSTVRFLGPALAVPVTLALVFVLCSILILLRPSLRGRWSRPALAGVLLLAALLIHPPTVLVAAPVVAGMAGYLATRRPRGADWPLLVTAALGLLLPLAWFLSLSGSLRSGLLSEAAVAVGGGQGLVNDFTGYVGPVRLSLFALAVFAVLFWKASVRSGLKYMAVLAAYGVLVGFVILHTLGILPGANLYDRAWLYLDVLLSIIAGLGIAAIVEQLAKSKLRVLQYMYGKQSWGFVLLAGVVVAGAVNIQSREPWYRDANQANTADFRWINEHLSDDPGLTLLDPYLAVIYPSVAGRPVYASAAEPNPSPEDRLERAMEFLRASQPDVAALRQENIGIVYRPRWQSSDGVVEVRPGVFVVSDGQEGP